MFVINYFLLEGKNSNYLKNILNRNFIVFVLIATAALVILFYPYYKASQLYGFSRGYSETVKMIPSLSSYFWGDMYGYSLLNSSKDVEMAHELQLFIGIVPFALIVLFFVLKPKIDKKVLLILLAGILLFIITLKFGSNYSLWYFISKLPLFNAIRGVGRIILVQLFPIALLAGLVMDKILVRWKYITIPIVLIYLLFLIEISSLTPILSSKNEWIQRRHDAVAKLPKNLDKSAILFYSQGNDYSYNSELDAMWAALKTGHPTLNGYSGNIPDNIYNFEFGDNCREASVRVKSYTQRFEVESYENYISRVYPIGFLKCKESELKNPIQISQSNYVISPNDFKQVSFALNGLIQTKDFIDIELLINNNSPFVIASRSKIDRTISITYAFSSNIADPELLNWSTRINLQEDIPNKESRVIKFRIKKINSSSKFLYISLVQELEFFSHSIGIDPLIIELN
jgi:hypothetical protein